MARQGPPCVGSLGQNLTSHQYDLIVSTWGNHESKFIVIVGDSDCKTRGYYALNFFEADVGDQIDYQQDLVD